MAPDPLLLKNFPSASFDGTAARRLFASLLGEAPISTGIVHPVATWRAPNGALQVMRINEETPKSPHDFFLLGAARARAQAIVTSGRILREEPGVRWTLSDHGEFGDALTEWRSDEWGRRSDECGRQGSGRQGSDRTPWVLVLTSGLGFDLDHPGLRTGVRPLIFTGSEGAALLAAPGWVRDIEVLGTPEPSLANALAELRRRGADRITVEVGPSTARSLYPPGRGVEVDELWLSTYLEPELLATVEGAELFQKGELEDRLKPLSAPREIVEESGRWVFQRWRYHTGSL